jgi:hypothetical protein
MGGINDVCISSDFSVYVCMYVTKRAETYTLMIVQSNGPFLSAVSPSTGSNCVIFHTDITHTHIYTRNR